jgi:hypothetical protein
MKNEAPEALVKFGYKLNMKVILYNRPSIFLAIQI